MADTGNNRTGAATTAWIIAAVAILLLSVGVIALIGEQAEIKSAQNTPGAKSSVNSPPPSPPREREPQAGAGSQQ